MIDDDDEYRFCVRPIVENSTRIKWWTATISEWPSPGSSCVTKRCRRAVPRSLPGMLWLRGERRLKDMAYIFSAVW